MKALYFENKLLPALAVKVASQVDRFAALKGFSPLKYAEVPEPSLPNARWLKVRNLACGLCGTDLHFMFMDFDPTCFPAAIPGISRKFLGHELVGEVTAVGAEVENLKVGDRVAMRIDWPSCNQLEIDPLCPQCQRGYYMLCENQGTVDLPLRDVGGGFSPYMVMHRSQPYKIPDELDNDHALLLEPLASAVHGVLKASPEPGSKILVIGAGTMGLMTVAALRGLFPETDVYCLARYPLQAEAAARIGATVLSGSGPLYRNLAEVTQARHVKGYLGNEILLGGFDVVYDTVGGDATLSQALRVVKGGGRVVLIGINFKPGKIDYTPVWAQEVELTGINCHGTEADGRTSFEVAAELLKRGVLEPEWIITHRFPVADYKDAVKTFLTKGKNQAIKIVLEHGK